MRRETEQLMERFPVRKSKAQKEEFRLWMTDTLRANGYNPTVETAKGLAKSHNIVVGDPEKADVVFTAHYDTPARMFIPNINFPHNMLITLLAQSPLILLMLVIAIGGELLVLHLTDNAALGILTVYAALILFNVVMLAGPANPHNVNDNTSGVATVLETALSLPAELRDRVAFLLFDNEEKGLMGSAAFFKSHKAAMKDKLLVNFDCVADGDHIQLIPSSKLKKRADLTGLLEESFLSSGEKEVTVTKGGHYSSDQRHFPCGVGVAALHKNFLGYYLSRIHTPRDTVFQPENVELLRRGAVRLSETLARQNAAVS